MTPKTLTDLCGTTEAAFQKHLAVCPPDVDPAAWAANQGNVPPHLRDSSVPGYRRLFSEDPVGNQCQSVYDAMVLAAADYQLTLPDNLRNADTKTALYQWIEETPSTSLIVELVKALNTLGRTVVVTKTGKP